MSARLFPPEPRFVNDHERDVCHRLVRGLPDGSAVLANLRVTHRGDDLEADLVVIIPESGVVVVEVKGGRVWHDEQGWWQATPEGRRQIDPFTQSMAAKRALMDYVRQDPRWTGGRVRWAHHVVLTATHLDAHFATPESPRWMVSDQDELPTLADRLIDQLDLHTGDDAAPVNRDQVDLLVEVLQGRGLPRDVVGASSDHDELVTRLTDEQALLLSVTRLVPRVEVRGGAGSGKTWLAMEHARRLADGRHTGRRERVAVVCYSYGLAEFLQRELLGGGSRGKQPKFVGTFEALANRWGIDTSSATRDNSAFWEQELPRLMAERADQLGDDERFDAIIVDEAQDFAEEWWHALLRGLRDPDGGRLGVYTDEHQRVFPRFGDPPVQLVPLVLDHNLRNTRQIYDAFAPLAPTGMSPRGGYGPDVVFVPCATGQSIEVADDEADALVGEGWAPRDVALLTVGHSHPVQKERQQSLGQVGYWAGYWDEDDIFYGHVLGFKGMERRAVVLCLNSERAMDREAERLYVGLSRATDLLVVVGDPEVVERMGGDKVRARLEAPGTVRTS
ncbi:NERD domain-containing protein [Propionibacteriaceae bacterium G57]|uniref:NERD domain-containing protein n=1 Tax=Aestuariimicrobium sp. G57 TaxID=3418485 RepID=UPI003DA7514E